MDSTGAGLGFLIGTSLLSRSLVESNFPLACHASPQRAPQCCRRLVCMRVDAEGTIGDEGDTFGDEMAGKVMRGDEPRGFGFEQVEDLDARPDFS